MASRGGGLGQTCLDTLFVFDTFPKFVIRKRLVKVDQCSKMRIVGNMRIVGECKGTSIALRAVVYMSHFSSSSVRIFIFNERVRGAWHQGGGEG